MTATTLGLASCEPPDTPPALAYPLPVEVQTFLEPDTVRATRIGAGVSYRYLWSAEGPWAIHVVEADLSRCDLGLRTLRALARESGGRGHEAVTSMVARTETGVLAAVNADFFTPEGDALGVEIVRGRVSGAHERPTLAWRRTGVGPWIGVADVASDTVWLGWPVTRSDGDGLTEAVGGYPELLDGGQPVGTDDERFSATRHPRTAVGHDPTTGRIWFIVVDGRQAPYSVGMTLPEMTRLLGALGAREALNLDGGGSSTIVIGRRARNRPSDETGERPVVNALALVRDASWCRGTDGPGGPQPPQITASPSWSERPGPGS